MDNAPAFDAKLLAAADECPGVKTFRFQAPPDFTFMPGMWVLLSFPDAPQESRAYSMASSPLEKGYIDLCCNRVGPFTERLFALEAGAGVVMRGPFGRWIYDESAPRSVLISEGTGITPLRSMCRYAMDRGQSGRLTLLYSAKTRDEQLFRREYAAWRQSGITVHAEAGAPIDLAGVERRVPDLPKSHFYLCGAKSLVEGLTAGLVSRGVPKERVHYEKWGDYSF